MNKRTKRVLMLGTCLAPFVIGVSTVMAVKGLSSGPALYNDMEERAAEWQAYAQAQLSDPTASQSVIDTLSPLKNSVCQVAGLEERDGILSGSPGKGALSAALVSSCMGITAIVTGLEDTYLRSEERRVNVTAVIQQLQSIPEMAGTPIFERQDLFRKQLVLLRKELSGGASENFRETVAAQIAVLSNSVITLETNEGELGSRQRAATASLKSQLGEVESIVNNFLAQTAPPETLNEPAELLSSGAAILRWWPRLTPQILLAVGVDLAILWMAGFLAVSRAALRELEAELSGSATGKPNARLNARSKT